MDIRTTIFAENGFPIEDRLGEIKEKLGKTFNDKMQQYRDDYEKAKSEGAKKVTLKTLSAFIIRGEVYKALAQFKMIDNDIANEATAEQITMIFCDFLELVSWLNEFGVFIPTKPIFYAFSGISAASYDYLMSDGDDEQKSAISSIENFLLDMTMEAASQGIVKERTTEFRLRARGSAGHGVRVATSVDDVIENAKSIMTQSEYTRMLGSIVTNELTDGKKK